MHLLVGLSVTQSHPRPHVSNDNLHSGSHFKTLKYRPSFPARFTSIEAARALTGILRLVQRQHPGGLGLHTAADVHYGRAAAEWPGRARVLTAVHLAYPERFVRSPPGLPAGSWINPPGGPPKKRRKPPLSKTPAMVPH